MSYDLCTTSGLERILGAQQLLPTLLMSSVRETGEKKKLVWVLRRKENAQRERAIHKTGNGLSQL